jgi:hypothetical protein
MKIQEIISLAEDQVEDIKTLPIIIKRSRHVNSIQENVILDEGVLDFLKPYVEKSKDKIASLREAIKRELWETGVMWEIIRKGTRAKDYEIKFANRQFKDMLKSVGLSAWYALPIPGNTLWITMTEKFLNKFGISILPDNVKDAFFGKVKERAVQENFADGKKPGRKGLAKRMRVPTKASVSRLRQIAKTSSGERARMAHWMANMKAGRKKKSQ